MMPAKDYKYGHRCNFVNCTSTSMKNKDLSFFRYPKGLRCEQWIINSGRTELLAKKDFQDYCYNLKVCSKHFKPEMFSNSFLTRLHFDAIPEPFEDSQESSSSQLLISNEKVPIKSFQDAFQKSFNLTNIPMKKSTNVAEESKSIQSVPVDESCSSGTYESEEFLETEYDETEKEEINSALVISRQESDETRKEEINPTLIISRQDAATLTPTWMSDDSPNNYNLHQVVRKYHRQKSKSFKYNSSIYHFYDLCDKYLPATLRKRVKIEASEYHKKITEKKRSKNYEV